MEGENELFNQLANKVNWTMRWNGAVVILQQVEAL